MDEEAGYTLHFLAAFRGFLIADGILHAKSKSQRDSFGKLRQLSCMALGPSESGRVLAEKRMEMR